MNKAWKHIIDSFDIETVLLCQSKEEGYHLAKQLAAEHGFKNYDVVYLEYLNKMARIRLRINVSQLGSSYSWLSENANSVVNEMG